MKKRIIDVWKLHSALCVILAILILSGVMFLFSYAEYTKSTRAKRVILTGESETLFSSNFLQERNLSGTVERNVVSVYASQADAAAEIQITVCNYAQTNPDNPNDAAIPYEISLKLVKRSNVSLVDATEGDLTAGQSVTVSLNGGTPVTLSGTKLDHEFTPEPLTARIPDYDTLTVTFTGLNDNAAGVMLGVIAEPASSTGLQPLTGAFSPTVAASHERRTWNGRFTDTAENPGDCDGFNYEISGNGAGSCTLTWDASQIDISEVFWKTEFSSPLTVTKNGNNKSVTFAVDSTVKEKYDLQFYPVAPISSFDDWNAVTSCVTFSFTG